MKQVDNDNQVNPKRQLSDEATKYLLLTRRDIYKGGITGFLVGITAGSIGFLSLKFIKKQLYTNNIMVLTILTSACFGSWFGSIISGKNSIINQIGLKPLMPVVKETYSSKLHNEIMNSEVTYERRHQAIRNSLQTREKNNDIYFKSSDFSQN